MEMHQVRYFVALAETLNFTRAAERCNVAQPSLTRAIRLLEDELGGPLFHRERNNTHLTELGRMMEPHLREVVEQAHAARRRAVAFAELKTARLKLGLARGTALSPIEGHLQRYAEAFPDTEILLIDERATELRGALARGDLEVVVMPGASEIEEFHHHTIHDDMPQVLMAEQHPLAQTNGVDLAALAGQTLVTCHDCPFWPEIEARLAERGIGLRRQIVAGSVDWLRPFLASGMALGLRGAAFGAPPGTVARPLTDGPRSVPIQLVTRRGRLYSPPVRAFVELVLRPRRAAASA
jgi:DNA-binding transcriptional LysR family regulator